ncbi:tRNA (adenosine(37)-N6)-dimethylallyltransferase MiaA [Porcipelethomonas sp.]|uniref:tRNA (adenosine(37)-N6)-dimethylallyltransferase MiaA n=1 Tax=Porcipelethomonas sp. TaxID=2981675 RepID=UPI003EF5CD0A
MSKIKIAVIAGPTASGKTALGVKMAKEFDGEVISADSMQIYKGMDIATAKPTAEEMEGIPHHLINFLDRNESFSVADYVELANKKIAEVNGRGHLPLIVGGTGLYISSLIDNVKFPEIKTSPEIRSRLEAEAQSFGNETLFERLEKCDPKTASELHPNNLVRVIRALEVYELTGRKLSEFKAESRLEESPYEYVIIGLNFSDRQKLYDRINRRVDLMAEKGLVNEAREIFESTEMKTAANAIGYKELIPYFTGVSDLSICIDKIKQETRRYAKRQLTWFRKNAKIQWIMLDEFDNTEKISDYCKKIIAKTLSL